jgi:hypothetical protein
VDPWQSKGFVEPELANQELNELFKSPELTADVENTSLECLRNAIKVDQTRVAETIFDRKPEG